MSEAARKLCRRFDLKFQPDPHRCAERCEDTIARLLNKYGEAPMVLTLRVFTETNPANTELVKREIVTAVHAVCRTKRQWVDLGLPFLEAWDAMDLGELHRLAISFGLWRIGHPVWATLATQIITRLEPVLNPLVPKPAPKAARVKQPSKPTRSITRIAEIRAKLDMGRKLLEMRANASSNRQFGRAVRRRFDLDQMSASEAMRVTRRYGSRWDITSRLSREALLQLSSPSLSAASRRRFEVAVLAGRVVTGPQIARARGRLPNGRPRRQERSAERMAA